MEQCRVQGGYRDLVWKLMSSVETAGGRVLGASSRKSCCTSSLIRAFALGLMFGTKLKRGQLNLPTLLPERKIAAFQCGDHTVQPSPPLRIL